MYIFQNLLCQMRDFEASAEPLQDWLNATELAVKESSARLHDLTAKKQELHKLQVLVAMDQWASITLLHEDLFTSPCSSIIGSWHCTAVTTEAHHSSSATESPNH